ncbi:MAG: phosphoribosylformylglycinamidine synthase subunit PurS [Bryobacterales bacterium]|nr:phosphoribosylformylglycinamidine synthase subunit PurS [Bryobacterales bacterium]
MKARVYVSPKTTVLDPQGQTIQSALNGMGFRDVASVRQGKFFELTLKQGADPKQAAADVNTMARDVLANPVIEDFRVEFIDD